MENFNSSNSSESAKNPEFPMPPIFKEIIEVIFINLANDPNTIPEILTDLVDQNLGERVNLAVASNPNTPPETLTYLVGQNCKEVTLAVASNPNTPPETLKELSYDCIYTKNVFENPALPLLLLADPNLSELIDNGNIFYFMIYSSVKDGVKERLFKDVITSGVKLAPIIDIINKHTQMIPYSIAKIIHNNIQSGYVKESIYTNFLNYADSNTPKEHFVSMINQRPLLIKNIHTPFSILDNLLKKFYTITSTSALECNKQVSIIQIIASHPNINENILAYIVDNINYAKLLKFKDAFIEIAKSDKLTDVLIEKIEDINSKYGSLIGYSPSIDICTQIKIALDQNPVFIAKQEAKKQESSNSNDQN
jgi:hypothetical protein